MPPAYHAHICRRLTVAAVLGGGRRLRAGGGSDAAPVLALIGKRPRLVIERPCRPCTGCCLSVSGPWRAGRSAAGVDALAIGSFKLFAGVGALPLPLPSSRTHALCPVAGKSGRAPGDASTASRHAALPHRASRLPPPSPPPVRHAARGCGAHGPADLLPADPAGRRHERVWKAVQRRG